MTITNKIKILYNIENKYFKYDKFHNIPIIHKSKIFVYKIHILHIYTVNPH